VVANLLATGLCVAAWGYFLYQGVVDPLGGINTLWPLFGIANQMLAAIALILGTCVLFKMKRASTPGSRSCRPSGCCCAPDGRLAEDLRRQPARGLPGAREEVPAALDEGKLLAPAKSVAQMQQIIFNDYLDAGLAAFFVVVVVSVLFFGIRTMLRRAPTASRAPGNAVPGHAHGAMMFDEIIKAGRYLGQSMRLMCGLPEYDTYVAHREVTHPGEPMMTYEEFFRERQEARYGGPASAAAAVSGTTLRVWRLFTGFDSVHARLGQTSDRVRPRSSPPLSLRPTSTSGCVFASIFFQ
jgi:uncharacterized short protein YbdD (DUF466 family)